jgi:hypothetical protein
MRVLSAGTAACVIAACSGQRPGEQLVSIASPKVVEKSSPPHDARQARMAPAPKARELCPPDTATVDGEFCIDRFEASLVEVMPDATEIPWSPFMPVEGHMVRAISKPHVFPQGYISAVQADEACRRSNKRLCKPTEWRKACMGPQKFVFGYGATKTEKRCNDYGKSPVIAMFGVPGRARQMWGWEKLNNPFLNQLENTLALTGAHEDCTNGYGVYDMVGNLHEWVADPGGTFFGGYYQDTHLHGDGCTYTTVAHSATYHDYSTGFRCCADPQL